MLFSNISNLIFNALILFYNQISNFLFLHFMSNKLRRTKFENEFKHLNTPKQYLKMFFAFLSCSKMINLNDDKSIISF